MVRGLAVGSGRYDRQDTSHQQVFPEAVAIIAFVGQQALWFLQRQRHEVVGQGVVGRFAAGQEEAERASLIVCSGVDLARKAAA